MKWLWLVDSFKLQVSLAKELSKRDYVLQKNPTGVTECFKVSSIAKCWVFQIFESCDWMMVTECVQTLYFCFQKQNVKYMYTGFFLPSTHPASDTFLCALCQVCVSDVACWVGYLDHGISLVFKFLHTHRLSSDAFYTRPLHTQPLHTQYSFATRLEMKGACWSFFFLSAFHFSPAHFVISFVSYCSHTRIYVGQILHMFSELLGQIRQMHRHVALHVSKFVEWSLPTIVAMRKCVCAPRR